MNRYYRLDEQHHTVPIESFTEPGYSEWWNTMDNRTVAKTEIGLVRVSTVFLGLDHQFGDGPPLLFETMLFAPADSDLDGKQERYSTWDDAVTGHTRWVERVQEEAEGEGRCHGRIG